MTTAGKETDLNDLLQRTIDELDAQLDVIAEARKALDAGSFDKDLALSAGNVARAIKDLKAEQRQQEKHSRTLIEGMSQDERDGLVAEYVRGLDRERLQVFRALLDELTESSSVLGL